MVQKDLTGSAGTSGHNYEAFVHFPGFISQIYYRASNLFSENFLKYIQDNNGVLAGNRHIRKLPSV